MLTIDTKHTSTLVVTSADTAEMRGSGDMPVFATPAMIALMENAAMLCVAPELAPGDTTVGAMMSTSHLKPSKIGATIAATATLVAVEERKLTFKVEAYEGDKLIGQGDHIRYIVSRDKFLSKLG